MSMTGTDSDEDDRSELNSAISSSIRALLVSRVDAFPLSSLVISRVEFSIRAIIDRDCKNETNTYRFVTRLCERESKLSTKGIFFSTRIASICYFLSLYLDRIMYAWYWSLFVFIEEKKSDEHAILIFHDALSLRALALAETTYLGLYLLRGFIV